MCKDLSQGNYSKDEKVDTCAFRLPHLEWDKNAREEIETERDREREREPERAGEP